MIDKEKKNELNEEKSISLGNLLGGQIKLDPKFNEGYEEIFLNKEVKKFSNSGSHITLPKQFIGRRASVFIKQKQEEKV